MQSGKEYRSTLDDVREIMVKNDSGEMVPLTSLGTLRYMVGPRQVIRFNKMTSADMNAQAKPGVSSQRLMQIIKNMKLPENYHIEWTGLSYQEQENEGQIIFLMILAMVFAYLFLVGQYESWTIPVPVMLTVSFAILGAYLGLILFKETLSIYAQLGMVMLIGLTAKNAILMVEFSKQEREEGKNVFDAGLHPKNTTLPFCSSAFASGLVCDVGGSRRPCSPRHSSAFFLSVHSGRSMETFCDKGNANNTTS